MLFEVSGLAITFVSCIAVARVPGRAWRVTIRGAKNVDSEETGLYRSQIDFLISITAERGRVAVRVRRLIWAGQPRNETD